MTKITKLQFIDLLLKGIKTREQSWNKAKFKLIKYIEEDEFEEGDQVSYLPYTNCFAYDHGKVVYYAGQDYTSEVSNFKKRLLK